LPTIVFASPKGGVGKSTTAVLLAGELALNGASVAVLDADPNQPVVNWASKPGKPDSLTVVPNVREETVLDQIEESERTHAFVLVDLEGTASLLVAQAMSRAHLVIVPCQGSPLDVREAGKAIAFLRRQERAFGRPIPFRLLFTRTSPAVRSRTLRALDTEVRGQRVPIFDGPLHERDAYRALFMWGGTLRALDQQAVANKDAAIQNVKTLLGEVLALLPKREKVNA
jgi:chromosome partitioning protein